MPDDQSIARDILRRPPTFLLVEDDEVDVMGIQRAFRNMGIGDFLVVARNGLEALAILRGEDPDRKVSRPLIILADLNMPKMNGLEFLDALRADPELKSSLVFVLTTSSDERDRTAAYDRNVAGYIVKGQGQETVMSAISMIDQYRRVVEIP